MGRLPFLLTIAASVFAASAAAQPREERAVRDLAERFFTAYAEQDSVAIPKTVSIRSPHRAELIAATPAASDPVEMVLARPITVRQIRIKESKATVQVLIEIGGGTEPATNLVAAERLLLCTHDGDEWRVWNLAPSAAELADGVTAAPTRAARLDVLGADAEWLGAEIWPALVSRGDRFFQLGRYPEAAKSYEAAVDVAEATGERTGIAVGVRGIGHVQLYAGEFAAALRAYERSLGIARGSGDTREIFHALNGVGNVRAALKETTAALGAYEESMRIAEAANDRSGVALVLNNIANMEVAQGHYDAALDRYRLALAIKESLGDQAAVSIGTYNIGRVLFLQRKYAESLTYQQRSLELAQSLGRKAGIASIHRSLGETYDRLHDHGHAIHHYQSAADVAMQIGSRGSAVDDMLAIGRLWRARGDNLQAFRTLHRAMEIADSMGGSARRARVLGELGLVLQARGAYPDAREAYETAQRLYAALGDQAGVADSLIGLASTFSGEGDDATALTRFDTARAVARSIGDQHRGLVASLGIARLHQAGKNHALALSAVEEGLELARRARDHDRIAAFELTAGRTYADLGRFQEARAAFDRAIASSEQSAGTGGRDPTSTDGVPARAAYLAAAELMLSRGSVAEAWTYTERGRANELRRLFQSGESDGPHIGPPRPASSRAATVIGYLVSERQVHVFVFPSARRGEPRAIRCVSVNIDRAALSAAVDRARGGPEDQPRPSGSRELYDLLIRPVARDLRSAHALRIIPDGPLWRLPFEALQGKDGRFLIEKHPLTYSLFVDTPLRSGRSATTASRPRALLAVGRDGEPSDAHTWLRSLQPDGKIPPVAGIAEAQRVAAVYAPSRSMALIGDEASESGLAAVAGNYRLLHFATVVRLDDLDPMHSGPLLLATSRDDGLLTPPEIAALRLSADAVVLSSVWSAASPADDNEGLALKVQMWAWRQAGCPRLVVSRSSGGPSRRPEVLRELYRALTRSAGVRGSPDAVAKTLRNIQLMSLARHRDRAGSWASNGLMVLSVN
jgi:tetratricopeptide (TPR) repeat protein